MSPRSLRYGTLFILFICGIILSCQKEFSTENGLQSAGNGKGGFAIPAPTPVNGSLAGRVVDENENPIGNAEVTVYNTTFFTDVHGFFNTSRLQLDKYITTVKVSKPGYYNAVHTLSANATKNYVNFKLIPRTVRSSFTSTSAGSVNFSNGSQIKFQPNSLVTKSNGAAYTGTVNVYAEYIDPTAPDISAKLPGSFIGKDSGKLVALRSKGMIVVELESASGEALQLQAGKPAEMKLAIPATLQATAPSVIDTWTLTDQGIWTKENTATRNGNVYEMQASHFSFWNCDEPVNAVYLNLNIKDPGNNNLTNTLVQLHTDIASGYGSSYGYTDSLGNVSGLVPANERLAMTVFSGYASCSNPLYTQNIGPFSSNASLNIIATLTQQQLLTVTGSATNCSGAAVANGTAVIYADYYHVYYTNIVNGNFRIVIPHCNSIGTLSVVAIDNISLMQSDTSVVPVTGTTINTGALSACATSVAQYISYTIDGTNYLLIPQLNDSIFASKYSSPYGVPLTQFDRVCSGMNCSYVFRLNVVGNSVGTFQIDGNCGLQIRQFYSFNMPNTGSTTFTYYGNVGDFVEGNFNIPFVDNTDSLNHLLTGNFKMIRQN